MGEAKRQLSISLSVPSFKMKLASPRLFSQDEWLSLKGNLLFLVEGLPQPLYPFNDYSFNSHLPPRSQEDRTGPEKASFYQVIYSIQDTY